MKLHTSQCMMRRRSDPISQDQNAKATAPSTIWISCFCALSNMTKYSLKR